MAKQQKVRKIDFSYERLGKLADKFYNEGKFIPALRFAYDQLELYGGDGDIYVRLADIYESMGLHMSAIMWLYKFLDDCEEADLPDIYEGLAVNYLNLGNESQSAYYYNLLIDVDDTLPEETKLDIAAAFSGKKKDAFRFVYPPEAASYEKELSYGSHALKNGDTVRAIKAFSLVEKGSAEYAPAKEMEAVAYLLSDRAEEAERICLSLLEDVPQSVQAKATLAAAYLEQGRLLESRALAEELAAMPLNSAEELYKVATVCCENGMHEEAYQKFCLLEKEMPYDGRMLFFKAVSAYKSGRVTESAVAFETLCTIYPDAAVAEYYLQQLRESKEGDEPIEMGYFYRIPSAEKERRKEMLERVTEFTSSEAQLFGEILEEDGLFVWCFDEMDGADHDLQYLALVAAEHTRADGFLREVLLEPEVADVLKVELLEMLLRRNEDAALGMVLCNIYRKLLLLRIDVGRKKRKKFVEGYAKVASRFVAFSDGYAKRIKRTAEELYQAVEAYDQLDLCQSADDIACAIYLVAGLKELGLGKDVDAVADAFGANAAIVRVLLTSVTSAKAGVGLAEKKGEEETKA